MTPGSESHPVDAALARDLVARALAGFNAHDPDAFTSVMTDDIVMHHSAYPSALHGKEAIKQAYTKTFWTAAPDLELSLADGPFLHPDAPRIALAWTVRGTQLGTLDPPGLPATGRTFELAVREIAEVHDGLIRKIQITVDVALLLRQLGVLPAQGSRSEKAVVWMQRLKRPRRRP